MRSSSENLSVCVEEVITSLLGRRWTESTLRGGHASGTFKGSSIVRTQVARNKEIAGAKAGEEDKGHGGRDRSFAKEFLYIL